MYFGLLTDQKWFDTTGIYWISNRLKDAKVLWPVPSVVVYIKL